MIFLALDNSAASMTLAASKTFTASMTSKAFFLKKLPDLDDLFPLAPKWCLFVDWILKNPNFYGYLALFLSETVEASQYYFFENLWIKLKFSNLLNVLLPFLKI